MKSVKLGGVTITTDEELLSKLKDTSLGTVTRRVTDADAWHLLTIAFEGGSNYWARVDDTHPFFDGDAKRYTYLQDVPFVGGAIHIEHSDGGEYEPCKYPLTRARCTAAFQLMADKHLHHWTNFVMENADADTGDVFLQLAVFGEIVYG